MSKYLVEQLREDHELLKDGYQDNLTRAWHDVAMKNTAMDCSEGADEIERLNGIIDNLAEALETTMDFIESNVADPDLTPEMWSHYRKLDHLEPRSLIAISKAHKVKE